MSVLPWILSGLLLLGLAYAAYRWWRAAAAATEAEVAVVQAERSAREARSAGDWQAAQLRALHQAHLDPVLVVGADHAVLEANPAASTLFGSQAGLRPSVIAFTRSVELDELVAQCLAGEAQADRQVRLGPAGAPYRARAVRAAGPGTGPPSLGVVVVLQDLTELQRLGRARRDFVANISHELRTPITSIRLLVDTLRRPSAPDPADQGALLEKISDETEALAQLSQELLDLAQIESGQSLMRLVPTRVDELVAAVVERFSPLAERKRQMLLAEVPADLAAWADVAQVTRALGNLVHNAIKFTPDAGTIWVRARPSDGDALFEVADTGPGIPPQDLPRVFERFFRGDRSRASGGTGLGLAIARHVVEAHGGRIWVESEGRPGLGAIFRFTLPAVEPAEATAAGSKPPPE